MLKYTTIDHYNSSFTKGLDSYLIFFHFTTLILTSYSLACIYHFLLYRALPEKIFPP